MESLYLQRVYQILDSRSPAHDFQNTFVPPGRAVRRPCRSRNPPRRVCVLSFKTAFWN